METWKYQLTVGEAVKAAEVICESKQSKELYITT